MSNQTIPNDDAQIIDVQFDNHKTGKCFTPWVDAEYTFQDGSEYTFQDGIEYTFN